MIRIGPASSVDPSDLLDGSILDAARALRERRVTVVELVSRSLDRIDATADLNAYLAVYREQSLKVAEAHQVMLNSGYDLGPLH